MSNEHEQFISKENEELKHIREKKIKELMELKEKKKGLSLELAHVTDSNFHQIVKEHPLILIDFWAPWCGPCLAIAPTIEELAEKYSEKVFFGKINVDENPRTAERFHIFSIPTLLIMKNGRELDRIVGLVPKNHVETAVRKHLG